MPAQSILCALRMSRPCLLCHTLQEQPVKPSVASAAVKDEEYADSDFDELLDPAAAAKSGKRQLRGASALHQSKKTKKG